MFVCSFLLEVIWFNNFAFALQRPLSFASLFLSGLPQEYLKRTATMAQQQHQHQQHQHPEDAAQPEPGGKGVTYQRYTRNKGGPPRRGKGGGGAPGGGKGKGGDGSSGAHRPLGGKQPGQRRRTTTVFCENIAISVQLASFAEQNT